MAITRLGGANAITGTIPNSVLAAGNVIQVVEGTGSTTNISTTSLSYVSAGTNATITPSSTSSKIFVQCFFGADYINTTNQLAYFTFYRGSTNLADGIGESSNLGRIHNPDGGSRKLFSQHFTFLDTPSTVSSTTYTLYVKAGASGDTARVRNDLIKGRMTLFEIQG